MALYRLTGSTVPLYTRPVLHAMQGDVWHEFDERDAAGNLEASLSERALSRANVGLGTAAAPRESPGTVPRPRPSGIRLAVGACVTMAGMRRARSRCLVSAVLVVWLIVGPWLLAFGPCAGMGMACGGPCAAAPSPAPPFQTAVLMPLIAMAAESDVPDPAAPSLTVPQPPPKSLYTVAA